MSDVFSINELQILAKILTIRGISAEKKLGRNTPISGVGIYL